MPFYTQKSQQGFTLIELLVVIAIIGTLASVVLASLNTARGKARDAKRTSEIQEVQKALQLYWLDNDGTYPNHLYTTCATNSRTCLSGLKSALVDGKYLPSIPIDPTHGDTTSGYRYYRTNTKTGYVLMVLFETDATISWCKWVIGDGTNIWSINSNFKDAKTDPTCNI